jgi:hypothetical protein
MTRATTIRAALATAIKAATPDNRATAQDVFRELDVGSVPMQSAPDRVFQIRLAAQPQRTEVNNCDTWVVEFELRVFYNGSQTGVDDRIAADTERIWGRIERLFETVAGVMRVDVSAAGIVDISDATVASIFSVIVQYQLDGSVITG